MHRVRRRHVVAALLVVLAVVWVRVNSPVEGPVLWSLNVNHGLTVADLPSIAAVIVAVVLVWPRPRKPS